jgi:aldehyde dehydrogenase (NAD+)
MQLDANLIDRKWVEGEAVPNVNPVNVAEVVGPLRARRRRRRGSGDRGGGGGVPGLEPVRIPSKTATEILMRKEEIGTLLSREEGKTLAEGIGETVRAAQIFDFFAGERLRLSGEIVPSGGPLRRRVLHHRQDCLHRGLTSRSTRWTG